MAIIREDSVAAAARFLASEQVMSYSSQEKRAFLTEKGVTHEEIGEAMRRNASVPNQGAPAIWMHGLPRQSQDGVGLAPWILAGLGSGSILTFIVAMLFPSSMKPKKPHHPDQTALRNVIALPDGTAASSSLPEENTGIGPEQLQELTRHIQKHVQETRDWSASLRRALDAQQKGHLAALSQLTSSVEHVLKDTADEKSNEQRELTADSLQQIRERLYPASVALNVEAIQQEIQRAATDDTAERAWLKETFDTLNRIRCSQDFEGVKALQTVSKIIHNIVKDPSLKKFREVNMATRRFHEVCGGENSPCAKVLCLMGFERSDKNLVFPENQSLDKMRLVQDLLLKELGNRNKKPQQLASKEAPWLSSVSRKIDEEGGAT